MFSPILILLAAGGSSDRFGRENKLLARFADGETVFAKSLQNLHGEGVLFAVATNDRALLEPLVPAGVPIAHWCPAGASRAETVMIALKTLLDEEQADGAELPARIAIHDAARPFATYELLQACCRKLDDCQADGAVAAHRVTDTIHVATEAGEILRTPRRDTLWAAETPQLFRKATLQRTLAQWLQLPPERRSGFTDDASLARALLLDAKILLFENTLCRNPKITYRDDLR